MKKLLLLLAALLTLPVFASDPPRTKLTGVEVERSLVPPLCTEEYQSKKAGEICRDTSTGALKRWDGSSWIAVGGGDMQKSVYDTDDNAIVDTSGSLETGADSLVLSAENTIRITAGSQIILSTESSPEEIILDSSGASFDHISVGSLGLGVTSWPSTSTGDSGGVALFVDMDGDHRWDIRNEPLLLPAWRKDEQFYSCTGSMVDDAHIAFTSTTSIPSQMTRATVYDATLKDGYDISKGHGLCWLKPATGADRYSIVIVEGGTGESPTYVTNRLRWFRARVSSNATMTNGKAVVGGAYWETNYAPNTLHSMVGFYCNPSADMDEDGVADDTWWAVVADDQEGDYDDDSTVEYFCATLADGNEDGWVDCDGDGADDTQWVDRRFSAVKTDVSCAATYQFRALEVVNDDGLYRFFIDGEEVAAFAANVPSDMALWGAVTWIPSSASASSDLWVDYLYYLGLP